MTKVLEYEEEALKRLTRISDLRDQFYKVVERQIAKRTQGHEEGRAGGKVLNNSFPTRPTVQDFRNR